MRYIPLTDAEEFESSADGVYQPSRLLPGVGFEIDRQAAEQPCAECGNVRRYIQVFHDGVYVAYAACDACQNAFEF